MSKKTESPAIQLLRHVWQSQGHQKGHSWERLNSAMQRALSMAIEHSIGFELGDFELMSKGPRKDGFNSGMWIGNDGHMRGEGYYSLACGHRRCGGGRTFGPNMSAALSFEAWKNRKPFIFADRPSEPRKRLCIGERFHWPLGDDKWGMATVTSFAEDGRSLIACTYGEEAKEDSPCSVCGRSPYSYRPAKIARRFIITIADLRAETKRRKELQGE